MSYPIELSTGWSKLGWDEAALAQSFHQDHLALLSAVLALLLGMCFLPPLGGLVRIVCLKKQQHLTTETPSKQQTISFGDIPNSSSIDILMPWAPFCAMVVPMWTMLSAWSKQSHGCSCPGCKATNHTGTLRNLLNPCLRSYTNTRRNSSEPSGTFRTLPLEPTPTRAGTLQNLPRPSGTNLTFRNLPPEPTPAYAGTVRNLPPEPTPAYAGTVRNLPEPGSGSYTSTRRNSPEPSGTFLRNLLLRPAPAHTGAYLGWRPH